MGVTDRLQINVMGKLEMEACVISFIKLDLRPLALYSRQGFVAFLLTFLGFKELKGIIDVVFEASSEVKQGCSSSNSGGRMSERKS